MYRLMARSEVLDHFMQKRFPTVKRYGAEGVESMIPALAELFRLSAGANLLSVVVSIPHRGRLNLLTDLLKVSPSALFRKLKGASEFPGGVLGSGDVVSHMFTSATLEYGGTSVQVTLLPNPSHLEAGNAVALGKARAKRQDARLMDNPKQDVLCLQVHGDASFCGQGVVMETFALSESLEYECGGSVHVIVNNQLGFTTSAQHGRTSHNCSDVAKMIDAPVIHVNADCPEAVVRAMRLAFEFRMKFRRDVLVDLIGYRRWGHNELDEPAFTQPLTYKEIRSRVTGPKLFEEKLIVLTRRFCRAPH